MDKEKLIFVKQKRSEDILIKDSENQPFGEIKKNKDGQFELFFSEETMKKDGKKMTNSEEFQFKMNVFLEAMEKHLLNEIPELLIRQTDSDEHCSIFMGLINCEEI